MFHFDGILIILDIVHSVYTIMDFKTFFVASVNKAIRSVYYFSSLFVHCLCFVSFICTIYTIYNRVFRYFCFISHRNPYSLHNFEQFVQFCLIPSWKSPCFTVFRNDRPSIFEQYLPIFHTDFSFGWIFFFLPCPESADIFSFCLPLGGKILPYGTYSQQSDAKKHRPSPAWAGKSRCFLLKKSGSIRICPLWQPAQPQLRRQR